MLTTGLHEVLADISLQFKKYDENSMSGHEYEEVFGKKPKIPKESKERSESVTVLSEGEKSKESLPAKVEPLSSEQDKNGGETAPSTSMGYSLRKFGDERLVSEWLALAKEDPKVRQQIYEGSIPGMQQFRGMWIASGPPSSKEGLEPPEGPPLSRALTPGLSPEDIETFVKSPVKDPGSPLQEDKFSAHLNAVDVPLGMRIGVPEFLRLQDSVRKLQTQVEERPAPQNFATSVFANQAQLSPMQKPISSVNRVEYQYRVPPLSGLKLPVPLTVFTGASGQVWRQWFEMFETAVEACGVVHEADKLRTLKVHLSGPALLVLKNCGPEADYDTVVSALKSRFQTVHGQRDASFSLFSRNQKVNESIIEYAHALQELAETAYGPVARTGMDAVLRDRFCAGALPAYQGWLRTHASECDTFMNAQMCAQLYENVLQSGFSLPIVPVGGCISLGVGGVPIPAPVSKSESVPTKPASISQAPESLSESALAQKMDENFSKMQSQIVYLTEQMQASSDKKSETFRGNPNRGRFKYQFTDTGIPICLYCKKAGHIRFDCRKRKEDETRGLVEPRGNYRFSRGRGNYQNRGSKFANVQQISNVQTAGIEAPKKSENLVQKVQTDTQSSFVEPSFSNSLMSVQIAEMQRQLEQMQLNQYPNMQHHTVTKMFSVPVLGKMPFRTEFEDNEVEELDYSDSDNGNSDDLSSGPEDGEIPEESEPSPPPNAVDRKILPAEGVVKIRSSVHVPKKTPRSKLNREILFGIVPILKNFTKAALIVAMLYLTWTIMTHSDDSVVVPFSKCSCHSARDRPFVLSHRLPQSVIVMSCLWVLRQQRYFIYFLARAMRSYFASFTAKIHHFVLCVSKGHLPYKCLAKIKLNGVDCVALLDTGATVSILGPKVLEGVCARKRALEPAYVSASGVASSPLKFSGSIVLGVEVASRHLIQRFHVLDSLGYDIIIGTDLLIKLRCVTFDFDNSKVFIPGVYNYAPLVPNVGSGAFEQFPVRLLQNEIVPPRTEVVLAVQMPPSSPNLLLIDSTPPKLAELGLVLAKTVSDTTNNNGCVLVRLMNVTDSPVCLFENQHIAVAEPINDSDVVFCLDRTESGCQASVEAPDPLRLLNFEKSILNQVERGRLLTLLLRFKDIFSTGPLDIGRCSKVRHAIPTGDSPPIKQRPYRVPNSQKQEVEHMIKDMLDKQVISRSSSPWASPLILVEKKDKTLRPCVDYRKLNLVVKKDSWPLPRIDDILDNLGKARYFTTLDLASGYWQIELEPQDREKTAFTCFAGLYEFNVLPFGLASAPSAFQRLMEVTLAGLQWKSALVYIDDVIIYSTTFDQHLKHLEEVFLRLREANLKLKAQKCELAQGEVKFLGHVISAQGIRPDETKTEALRTYKVPKSVTEVRQFIGLCGFYRRFVPGFASIAAPLYSLLRKNATGRFVWSKNCQSAFEKLVEKLVSPPLLAHADYSKPFVLTTDASTVGLGAILHNRGDDLSEKPIAYASRSLDKHERNYAVTELEALAVVWAMKHFRCYLYGRKFELVTDHSALKWLMSCSRFGNMKLQRWALLLQEYDFTVIHRAGKANANADALSRAHASSVESANVVASVESGSEFSKLLKSHTFFLDSLRVAQREDSGLQKIIEKVRAGVEVTTPSEPEDSGRVVKPGSFALRDDILVHIPSERTSVSPEFPDQLVVPLSHRARILEACHDNIFGGHLGFDKVYQKVSVRFYWPGMKQTIADYIRHCGPCQAMKNPTSHEKAPLVNIPVGGPFERVAVDVIGPLPLTERGNKLIVVFTDYLTKWTECFCVPDQKATTIAKVLVEGVICRHSAPVELLSDQGTNFLSEVVQKVCELFRVKKVEGTPFHSQTDGLCERYNKTLAQMLSFYVNSDHTNWDELVPYVQFAYRTSVQASTKESPFFLLYGRQPRLPIDTAYQTYRSKYEITVDDYARECAIKLTEAHKLAHFYIDKAQVRQKRLYDLAVNATNWKVGDVVYKYTPTIPIGLCKKFVPKWSGPFIIQEIDYPNVLLFDTVKQLTILPWVHVNRIKRGYIPDGEKSVLPETSTAVSNKKGQKSESKVPNAQHNTTHTYNLRSTNKNVADFVHSVFQESDRSKVTEGRVWWNMRLSHGRDCISSTSTRKRCEAGTSVAIVASEVISPASVRVWLEVPALPLPHLLTTVGTEEEFPPAATCKCAEKPRGIGRVEGGVWLLDEETPERPPRQVAETESPEVRERGGFMVELVVQEEFVDKGIVEDITGSISPKSIL